MGSTRSVIEWFRSRTAGTKRKARRQPFQPQGEGLESLISLSRIGGVNSAPIVGPTAGQPPQFDAQPTAIGATSATPRPATPRSIKDQVEVQTDSMTVAGSGLQASPTGIKDQVNVELGLVSRDPAG